MSLALQLSRSGHDVTLYDAGDTLGGLAAPWQVGDVTWDRHYHVTLLSDRRTRDMYAAVGLTDDDLRWVETRTGYYGPDRTLRSVSNAVEFLRLPGLSLLDKVRLGGTIVVGSKIRNGHRMERITVERWLRRWSGNAAFDEYRAEQLRRLEEERKRLDEEINAFHEYMRNLRMARDREEFDRFMRDKNGNRPNYGDGQNNNGQGV
mgnify:CR=1 FL=1